MPLPRRGQINSALMAGGIVKTLEESRVNSGDETLRIARDRVTRIFRYLEALNQHRNPAKRQTSEQLWALWFGDLPDHPSIRLGNRTAARPEEMERSATGQPKDVGDFILRVKRPDLTRAPGAPDVLAQWLERGWDDPAQELGVRETINEAQGSGESRLVRFEDDPGRVKQLQSWSATREQWAQNERPARAAMRVFERLYETYGRMEREAERVELVIGDGILSWRVPSGGIFHPILLQRVQLQFDPDIPEFRVIETEHQVELYTALLRTIPGVDTRGFAQMREELEKGGYHPLGDADTDGFLRRFVLHLSPRGQFENQSPPKPESDEPIVGRSPILFLRERTLGFAAAIEGILSDLSLREDLPGPLVNVVGIEQHKHDSQAPASSALRGYEPEEILFAKPWNTEQVRVAERLDREGAVLVQGPPGTGKSHTIANLVGHLLAQGQSVLITAHTTKALRVLRSHVIDTLRPLCVSVLESDLDSRKQLEQSVESIVERLSKSSAPQLDAEAKGFANERRGLLARLRDLRAALLEARASEYREIEVLKQTFTPADAARKVARDHAEHGWIPSPVEFGTPIPLSHGELITLYRTNASVTPEDERELSLALPNPTELPTPEDLVSSVRQRADLLGAERNFRDDLWAKPSAQGDPEQLEIIVQRRLLAAAQIIHQSEPWKLAAIAAGQQGEAHRKTWEQLLTQILDVLEMSGRFREVLIRYDPRPSHQIPLDKQQDLVAQVLDHMNQGRKVGTFTLITRRDWRKLISESQVNQKPPRTVEDFRALQSAITLAISRRELTTRWERQITILGGPQSTALGTEPELAANQFAQAIRLSLDWRSRQLDPAISLLEQWGFRWQVFVDEQPPNLSPNGDLIRLADGVTKHIPRIINARANSIRLQNIENRLSALHRQLELVSSNSLTGGVVSNLRRAVATLDVEGYGRAFDRLVDLHRRQEDLLRRRELLERLEAAAPSWAQCIRDRQNAHGGSELPGDPASAWLWRQLHDELERRGSAKIQKLQEEVSEYVEALRRITIDLIDRLAWEAQVRRTTLQQRQALMGWLGIVRRIGRGYGRMVSQLRAEAAKRMIDSRTAVPVWIMPLSRVVEHFDPRTTRFDVVIIDEASQSDAMALITFYLARRVVIVGDHQQVSPEAVGQDLDVVHSLIREYLQGIPNAILYDGRRSIYDIARESFGGTIVLEEHFRCVPDIIQFSNWLSYEWRIKPLRDPSTVTLRPYVVPQRVHGTRSAGKVNWDEVFVTASLLVAATEQQEYSGKNFGVVSLLGEEQAFEIDRVLRRFLPPDQYDRRRVLCGTAAQFQGDERDVMLLSVVDASQNGPLPLRQDERFKQRFNVAASRARDQMWVIYSLDPARDLKPGDLRRQLIEYAIDPSAVIHLHDELQARAESEFERAVIRQLVNAGYHVRPQYPVGSLRIDVVVEGNGKRLAIECDGDRYHPIEKLPEDMERQAILERLGWRFVRLRGSHFFRAPEEAMRMVFDRLRDLEIPPEPAGPTTTLEPTENHALIRRVEMRAAKLREEWAKDPEIKLLLSNQDQQQVTRQWEPLLPADKGGRGEQAQYRAPETKIEPAAVSGQTALPSPAPAAGPIASEPKTPRVEESLVEWVSSIDPKVWFSMAHWAKLNDHLSPWERALLFSMGRYASRSWKVSDKQAQYARRVYDQLLAAGFDPERDVQDSTTR